MSIPTPTAESNLQVDMLAWLEVHKSRIAAAFGIAGVAIIGYLIYSWRSDRREVQGSYALVSALRPSATAEENRVSSATLLRLAGDYEGTRAGERALLLGAGRLYAEGNYADARQKFEAFKQQYPESPFVPIALLGSATCLDALNQTAEALGGYQDLIANLSRIDAAKGGSGDPLVNQAKLARARIFESQNQPEQAFAIYEEMSKAMGDRMAAQQAGIRREALVAKFPELLKTSALTNTVNVVSPPGAQAPAVPTNIPAK